METHLFSPISVSGSDFDPRNTQSIPAVRILSLTLPQSCGIALAGSLTAAQFHCYVELPLTLNKTEGFPQVSSVASSQTTEHYSERFTFCLHALRGFDM